MNLIKQKSRAQMFSDFSNLQATTLEDQGQETIASPDKDYLQS